MRIYYDLIIWEEIEQHEVEKLQNRVQEFGKRLNGFGILSFNMRATPPAESQLTQQQADDLQALEDEKILQEEEAIQTQTQQPPQQPPQQPQQPPTQLPPPAQQPGEIIDE